MLEELNKLCDTFDRTEKDFTKQSELKTIEDLTTYIDSVDLYEKVKTLMYLIDGLSTLSITDPELKSILKEKYSSILRFIQSSSQLSGMSKQTSYEDDLVKVEELYNEMVNVNR
jgi:hypothetical protein